MLQRVYHTIKTSRRTVSINVKDPFFEGVYAAALGTFSPRVLGGLEREQNKRFVYSLNPSETVLSEGESFEAALNRRVEWSLDWRRLYVCLPALTVVPAESNGNRVYV